MTRLAIISSLFFIFLFSVFRANSQRYLPQIRHYTNEEGLSNNTVHSIHKDARGFLWFGTDYGLNRFNGKEFEWFFKENKGLTSNIIHHIFEDKEGYLWLITLDYKYDLDWFDARHISLLHINTGEVLSLSEKFADELPFETNALSFIKQLPDGALLFVTRSGSCYLYQPETGFSIFQLDFDFYKIIDIVPVDNTTFWTVIEKSINALEVSLIKTDTSGKILEQIDGHRGYSYYYVGTDTLQRHFFGLRVNTLTLPPVTLLSISPKGIPSEQDLSVLDLPWHRIGQPPVFRAMSLDTDNHFIWGKANNQVVVFHPEEGLIHDFENASLTRDARWDMKTFFDGRTTWMTDSKSGLYAIELNPNRFQLYLTVDPNVSQNFYSCRGIVTDHLGRLWVSSYRGVQIVDKNTEEMISFPNVDALPLIKDREGNIWAAETDGLLRFNPKDDQPKIFEKSWVSEGGIWAFYEDRKGNIWYSNGLNKHFLNPKTGKYTHIDQFNEFEEFDESIIYWIAERNENTLWMAGSKGLFIFHLKKGILAQYNAEQEQPFFLPAIDIHHLYEDKDGKIWLATGDEGLIQLTLDDQKLKITNHQQFTIANGLSGNTLHAVYEDDFNHLWISSENGIIQFNKANHQSKNYLLKAGISDNEFNRVSHHQGEDGTIYFGSVNGVTAFHPRDFYNMEGPHLDAPLQIVSFQQFSHKSDTIETRTAELIRENRINLRPGDRFFDLKFSLLDYENSDNVQYAYLIEGLNKKWTLTRENHISVSGLPYGDFTLRVKGHSGDGHYSKNELAIPIRVIRPVYLRWWFLGLVFLSGIIGIASYLRWRTARLQQQKRELEKQVKERTQTISEQAEQLREMDKVKSRFFANVSHELRTPLTLMLGPISSLLKNRLPEARQEKLLHLAQNNGRQLLQLINEILDLTKLESSQLELKETPTLFYSLVNRLVANFESYAKQKEIRFHVENQTHSELSIYLDVDKFEKIVNNLISNAIKFTPAKGAISILIDEEEEVLRFQVKDNGPGIHPNDLPYVFDRFYQSKQPDAPTQGGTGIGLALCREYANLFQGKIWVESELEKGAVFTFEFPKKAIQEIGRSSSEIVNEIVVPSQNESSVLATTAVIPPSENGGRETLLLVEDNLDLQAYLTSILKEKYKIVTAGNGQEALDHLTGITSDPLECQFIISDVMMPVMDGFTFLTHLKSNPTFQQIPVIMLTARAEKEDKLKALRIGVDDYLLKPFEEEELLVRIENLLRNSKQRHYFSKMEEAEQTGAPVGTDDQLLFPLSQEEQQWLEQLENTVLAKISNFDFNTEGLAQDMAISRRQLNRRIKKMTGLTSGEYIREVRFQQARHLLEIRKYATIKAVAYSVGVKALDYFAKQFKERYGRNPSEYLKK